MKIHLDQVDAQSTPTPERIGGRLLDAERLARYRWAAQAAGGRDVLDAGSETAAGAGLLGAAGARTVVQLEQGHSTRLPYEEASFDLITCFELIERYENPLELLDELTRVLRPDGLLVVSASDPTELGEALGERLANVALADQREYLMSVLLGLPGATTKADETVDVGWLDKAGDGEPDGSHATVAVASDAPLPHLGPLAVLTVAGEPAQLSRLLVEAEQRLADLPALKLQIADLERQAAEAQRTSERLKERLVELDGRLMQSKRTLVAVMSSPSWKLTKPLRVAKRLLRG